ncbi:MAG TPA: SgcJ/EcaC family oxidoreductase [Bryobacteraceae bacterium]|nr:SgcJ/EcaC family oxidoreductase [Bryobacteraceae bacterium]
MKYASLLLAACLSISSPARLLAASNPDEEHVREVIAGLMRAWNVHDMHAFTEQFTDDASFVNVNGSWLRNAGQIEESHKVVHGTIFKASRAVITPAQVQFPKPDVAIVHARWQITGDSRRPEARDYVMTLVLRKKSDVWKILAAQNGSAEDRSTTGFANLRPGDVAPIPAPRPQSSPLTDEDRIGAALAAFDSGWNRRDQSGISELLMRNADWVDTAARWVRGNRDIAANIVNMEWPGLKDPTLTSGVERLTLLHPDMAFAQVRWKVEGAGSPGLQTQGMGLRVLERVGTAWQILAAQDTIIRASAK